MYIMYKIQTHIIILCLYNYCFLCFLHRVRERNLRKSEKCFAVFLFDDSLRRLQRRNNGDQCSLIDQKKLLLYNILILYKILWGFLFIFVLSSLYPLPSRVQNVLINYRNAVVGRVKVSGFLSIVIWEGGGGLNDTHKQMDTRHVQFVCVLHSAACCTHPRPEHLQGCCYTHMSVDIYDVVWETLYYYYFYYCAVHLRYSIVVVL